MEFSVFKKLIDDVSEFPSKVKLLRICGNGDPLMNKNIVRMLQYTEEEKVAEKVEMLTNGLLLSSELIKVFR